MLSNSNRLRSDSDFAEVRNKGTLHQGQNFAISMRDRGDSDPSRFGIIVSTKISKSAVARNKVKRIIREGVVEVLDSVNRGMDVVFLVKPSILKVERVELIAEVKKEMKNANLTK